MIDKSIDFSLWLDFVERDYLKNEFGKLLADDVVTGATSNPAIFALAISKSPAYKEQLESLKDKTPKEKYEALAIEDIKTGAKALREIYNRGDGGYISIEVDPSLAHNAKETIEEGKRLFREIDEPNVMIKVPATKAGYKAMRELLFSGISVNATLIFSPNQAKECIEAMREGIEKTSNKVDGVISVFISRFDRLLDRELEEKEITPSLTGIYNGAKIYNMIEKSGVKNIKTLFASTGVKGDNLVSDYYITNLLASHSINTAPLDTIKAYLQTDKKEVALPIDEKIIDEYFQKLKDNGIDIDEVSQKLFNDGLVAFEEAFSEMLRGLEE